MQHMALGWTWTGAKKALKALWGNQWHISKDCRLDNSII